jgi:hypothetical protein
LTYESGWTAVGGHSAELWSKASTANRKLTSSVTATQSLFLLSLIHIGCRCRFSENRHYRIRQIITDAYPTNLVLMSQENEPPFQLHLQERGNSFQPNRVTQPWIVSSAQLIPSHLSPRSPYSFLPTWHTTSPLSRDRWLPQSDRWINRSRLSSGPISSAPSNDSRRSWVPLDSYRSRQPSPGMESVQSYRHFAHQSPTSPRFHLQSSSYPSPKPEPVEPHQYSSQSFSEAYLPPKLPLLRLGHAEFGPNPQFSSRFESPPGSAELPFLHVDAMDPPAHSGQESNVHRVPHIRPTVSNKGELSFRVEGQFVSSDDVSPSQPDQTRRLTRTSPAKRQKPPEPYSSYANMLADIIYSHPRGKMTLQEILVRLIKRAIPVP